MLQEQTKLRDRMKASAAVSHKGKGGTRQEEVVVLVSWGYHHTLL